MLSFLVVVAAEIMYVEKKHVCLVSSSMLWRQNFGGVDIVLEVMTETMVVVKMYRMLHDYMNSLPT